MARVYLGLGSNIDPENNLRLGVAALRDSYGNLDISPVYKNAAVGFEGPDFLNLVVGLDSDDSPTRIQACIERIHKQAGRHRGEEKLASRPLDIDLLLYDDLVLEDPPLPRSDVLDYAFVLQPLADLAPDVVHPISGQTIAEHWQAFGAARHPMTLVDVIL